MRFNHWLFACVLVYSPLANASEGAGESLKRQARASLPKAFEEVGKERDAYLRGYRFLNLARSSIDLGDHDAAREGLKQAIAAADEIKADGRKTFADLYAAAASIQVEMGDVVDASETFRKGVKRIESLPTEELQFLDWPEYVSRAICALGTRCAEDVIKPYKNFINKEHPNLDVFDHDSCVLSLRVLMNDLAGVSKSVSTLGNEPKTGITKKYAAGLVVHDLAFGTSRFLRYRNWKSEDEPAVAAFMEQVEPILVANAIKNRISRRSCQPCNRLARLGRFTRAEKVFEALRPERLGGDEENREIVVNSLARGHIAVSKECLKRGDREGARNSAAAGA